MPRVREEDVSAPDGRLEQLERLIEDELLRRLKDPDAAKELPAHSLARLYDSVTKHKKPEEGPTVETVEMDVFEMVDGTELPPERKQELIRAERARLQERLVRLGDLEGT